MLTKFKLFENSTIKPIYLMSVTGKEYSDVSYDDICKQAFGFCEDDIKQIDTGKLHIKWKDDLENAVYQQKHSGLSEIKWAKTVDLTEPIQLSFEKEKFWIEDGHHRYLAAKILGKKLNVDEVDFRDKPHITAVKKALSQGIEIPDEVLKDYPELIKEGKQVGTLYHWTDLESLELILKDDEMVSETYGYISFSRNKRLNFRNRQVRITFDGDKMSDKFKFKPHMYGYGYSRKYKEEAEERIKCDKLKYRDKYRLVKPYFDYISGIKKYITDITIKGTPIMIDRLQEMIPNVKINIENDN